MALYTCSLPPQIWLFPYLLLRCHRENILPRQPGLHAVEQRREPLEVSGFIEPDPMDLHMCGGGGGGGGSTEPKGAQGRQLHRTRSHGSTHVCAGWGGEGEVPSSFGVHGVARGRRLYRTPCHAYTPMQAANQHGGLID